MDILVKLLSQVGKLDTKIHELTNEQITYVFNSRFGVNTKQVLTLQNGDIQRKIVLENKKALIPQELIKAGELKGLLEVFIDGTVIQRYAIEKLIITETKEKINVIPELEELKKEIAEISKKVDEIYDYTKITRQLVLELNNITEQIGGNE